MDKIDFEIFPFWDRLSDDEKADVKREARIVNFSEDQVISSTESECLGVLYVLSGIIRLFLYSDDGREVTIARLVKDDMCLLSASCIISQVSFPAQVSAETDVRAVLVPVRLMDRLKNENIYVENYIYKETTEKFSDVISAVEKMMFMTLEERIIMFLLNETADSGSDTVYMTHEKLAQAIGSARETVTRALKKLSKTGEIEVFRGGIRIIDRKALYNKARY